MKKALLLVCFIALSAIGQPQDITSLPGNPPILTITFLEGKGPAISGAVKLGDTYANNYEDIAQYDKQGVDIIYDTPGKSDSKHVPRANIVGAEPERWTTRENRYKDAGYVVVTVGEGKEMLLHETTDARLQRLAELEQARDEREDHLAAIDVEVQPTTETTQQGPPFITLWGRHILTVVVAGLLLVVVVKTCF